MGQKPEDKYLNQYDRGNTIYNQGWYKRRLARNFFAWQYSTDVKWTDKCTASIGWPSITEHLDMSDPRRFNASECLDKYRKFGADPRFCTANTYVVQRQARYPYKEYCNHGKG